LPPPNHRGRKATGDMAPPEHRLKGLLGAAGSSRAAVVAQPTHGGKGAGSSGGSRVKATLPALAPVVVRERRPPAPALVRVMRIPSPFLLLMPAVLQVIFATTLLAVLAVISATLLLAFQENLPPGLPQ
jgi:hypothetical protein